MDGKESIVDVTLPAEVILRFSFINEFFKFLKFGLKFYCNIGIFFSKVEIGVEIIDPGIELVLNFKNILKFFLLF